MWKTEVDEVPPSPTQEEKDWVPRNDTEWPLWTGSLTWVTWGRAKAHVTEN